jgi:hypothetical protein
MCHLPSFVERKDRQTALGEKAMLFQRRLHRDYRLAVAFFVDFAATTAFDLDFGAGALPFSGLITSVFGAIAFGATALAVLAAGLAVTFGAAVTLVVVLAGVLVVTVFVAVALATIGSLVVVGFMALTFPEVFATPDDLVGLAFSLPLGLSELKADAQFWTYLSVAPLLKIVTA